MRIYIGFDDTDTVGSDRGTGKLARWFEDKLPQSCRLWGVVRQQLPVLPGIPYTSRNSAACVVVDSDNGANVHDLAELAARHIQELFIEGSDPGVCIVRQDDAGLATLMGFGRECCQRRVSQKEALQAARTVHLSGHGGTNDGIIGAAAGVGLTLTGWSGRFVEFGRLREFSARPAVAELEQRGIQVLSVDRDALVPGLDDRVHTDGWLRPRLWGGGPVLPVQSEGPGVWRAVGIKKGKRAAGRCAGSDVFAGSD